MIERELGGGGMSRVFLAEEIALGRKVIIKVLPAELAAEVNLERFHREIQLAAKLQHPYIVPVLSTGSADGIPYYTMPFVEGESLRARLQNAGALPVSESVAILRDLLEALAYAHDCGVVHRDIKPENVLLARNHAHVVDFGVAKALTASTAAQSGLTSIGVALGTPAYMAPEQAMADPAIDHRADLYAAGALAYEMLTGAPLYTTRSPQAMLAAHAILAPEPLLNRRPNTPQALADLVMRLLEKEPAARPQRAEDALHELGRVTESSGEAVAAARPATPVRAPARSLRFRISIGIAAAVILVLAGGFLFRRMGLRRNATVAQSASIAVLPFANMSGDPQNDYLGDGLSEELIGGLSQVQGLEVAARSSSFAFKGKNENVRSIGTTLGVRSVLNGSVRKAGNRLRVTVQLTNVSTGYNLWSETYDREMRDVFAVEDDISHAIVTTLAVRLRGAQAHGQIVEPTTTDPEAYDLYLKGRYAWNQRGTKLRDAERFFKQAIARDSTFALAWSGLADTYVIMAGWGYISYRDAAVEAPRYAEKAVSLDSTLQEPRVSLGHIHCHLEKRYEEGLAELRHAIDLNPSGGNAHYFYSICLYLSGDPREALVEGLESQRLEPLNAQLFWAPSTAYIALGKNDSAIAVAKRATKLAPALASPYPNMMLAYAAKGDIVRARWAAQEAAIRRPELQVTMKAFLAILTHDSAEVTALHPQIMAHIYLAANDVAVAYSLTRNADSTLVWLDRAYSVSIDALGIVHFPSFDWLRKDPRFLAFRKRYGIPDVKH